MQKQCAIMCHCIRDIRTLQKSSNNQCADICLFQQESELFHGFVHGIQLRVINYLRGMKIQMNLRSNKYLNTVLEYTDK